MKTSCTALFILFALLLGSCVGNEKGKPQEWKTEFDGKILDLSKARTKFEQEDNLESFVAQYDEHSIGMPEYQPTLTGPRELEMYYSEIFRRQDVTAFAHTPEEVFHFDSTIIEIGTFKKEYIEINSDSAVTQDGKYWHVWHLKPDGSIKLAGEAFGYVHPVKHAERLVVDVKSESDFYAAQPKPFELKAYNALMEKGVRIRDGLLRSEFFTDDGRFMPFQEPTVNGMDEIKPYLIAYSSRGDVTIDSIACNTYHAEDFGTHILEFATFKVKWTFPKFSGRTEGKGIRIWKRQPDNSLRLFREIGTHNFLE